MPQARTTYRVRGLRREHYRLQGRFSNIAPGSL